jgi:hypothetical protein
MELSLQLFVSLLNVDADTDGDEQECAGDDQNDNKRVAFAVGSGSWGLNGGHITRLVSDLPVVSIEANVLVERVGVVQHHVVVAENGIADDVSNFFVGAVRAVDEELASVIIQSLVLGSKIRKLPVNCIVILVHGKNVLSEVLICLFIRFGSVEI